METTAVRPEARPELSTDVTDEVAHLRQAQADLEASYRRGGKLAHASMMAHVEYEEEHGEPLPFPYSKDDPKMAAIVRAGKAIDGIRAEQATIKARIAEAERALSRVSAE